MLWHSDSELKFWFGNKKAGSDSIGETKRQKHQGQAFFFWTSKGANLTATQSDTHAHHSGLLLASLW